MLVKQKYCITLKYSPAIRRVNNKADKLRPFQDLFICQQGLVGGVTKFTQQVADYANRQSVPQ